MWILIYIIMKKKISIATDIGHMDNSILHKLEGSNFLLLESNYEPEILKYAKISILFKTENFRA